LSRANRRAERLPAALDQVNQGGAEDPADHWGLVRFV
jgi:hypothetical protein